MKELNVKNITTLFPECGNNGLVKDVGMIPFILGKEYNFVGKIASCDLEEKGDYLHKEVDSIAYDIIPKTITYNISGLLYIIKHAKEIDILNLYHFKRRNIVWMYVYKILNHHGKTYIKLDMDFSSIDLFEKNEKKRKKFVKMLGLADIVSVESSIIQEKLKKFVNKKIVLIPNGYYDFNSKETVKNIKKNNTILTVGRLGTNQKATEVLLEAFSNTISLHNYKLKLVGSIESEFNNYIDNFFNKNPKLKDRIEFVGQVNDKTELMKYYEEAKIFILTSRWEGFPLVLPEAMINGCYLLLTDKIPPARDLICNDLMGIIMETDNVDNISNAIIKACQIGNQFDNTSMIKNFGKQYRWENICENLNNIIKNIENK